MIEHGVASAYRHRGCRCDACREANTAWVNRRRWEREDSRVVIDGRLVATQVPAQRHGRVSTYTNWGCRCVPCSAAGAARNARAAAARAAKWAPR